MNNTTRALVGANTTKKRVLSPLAKQLPINRCLFCHGTGDALDHATLGLGGAIICVDCAVDAAAQVFARRRTLVVWEEEESRFPDHPRHIGHDDDGEELFTIEPAAGRGGRTTFHHYALSNREGYAIGQAGDFQTLRHKAQQLVDGATLLKLVER